MTTKFVSTDEIENNIVHNIALYSCPLTRACVVDDNQQIFD